MNDLQLTHKSAAMTDTEGVEAANAVSNFALLEIISIK